MVEPSFGSGLDVQKLVGQHSAGPEPTVKALAEVGVLAVWERRAPVVPLSAE